MVRQYFGMRSWARGALAFASLRTIALAGAMAFFAAGVTCPAHATLTTLTFDFNTLANGASNTSVQNYMDALLGGNLVTVTGSQAATSYNGDGHVVGPGNGSTSLTLGTSDGTTQHLASFDTFIQNVSSATEISITFGVKILSVSFDYEIFPDGTCPTGHNCGSNWPDFSFKANGTTQFDTQAVMPGNPGAPYLHSPASGGSNTELAPQFLGQSGLWSFANGVTTLEFVDWPATIAIDNLTITYDAPEPASIVVFGSGLLALMVMRRRQRRAIGITNRSSLG